MINSKTEAMTTLLLLSFFTTDWKFLPTVFKKDKDIDELHKDIILFVYISFTYTLKFNIYNLILDFWV